MKSLRNLVTAICWVWGTAALITLTVLTSITGGFALAGLLAGVVLSGITLLVYAGLNDAS
jgi:hypothetical protein